MSNAAMSAVFRHSASKGSARLVLLAMADEANDQGLLTAYRRSQSYLGTKANVDGGTVRRAIATLVELGEVQVLTKGDGRDSSDYVLCLPGLDAEGVQDAPPAPAKRTPTPGEARAQGVQDAPPIIPVSPPPPGSPTTRAPAADVVAFEAFWSAYPRKTAKGDARKAWPAAVKAAGGAAPIITGAMRYRADPNRAPEFTAHASTWLRGERWNDDPLPPRAAQRGTRPPRPNPANVSAVDEAYRNMPTGRLDLDVDP